ncbi:MAG: hypothetical protein COU31_04770 [Candidatus Magasanikbacteria bacterium CG10_big_fil_rev_8_21_14_0_10_40_10]|uniref:PPM-type phosphatase domain-containing protein n=1 Tax=Candidatus Magasanikbacteria bacterium CG10_big_fil_rev_8_21_14_0_10_40_10 TaxID=1974648 RepID=A0A2M6W2P1_9BACT|nr:MAG: hypothetical protein COU31_04770 [Candidatus Magasanikbacteria bacterium CG10_big_fil_rev_8_21_14_0_10_40_10]
MIRPGQRQIGKEGRESEREKKLSFEFGVSTISKMELSKYKKKFQPKFLETDKPNKESLDKNGDAFLTMPEIGVFAVLDGVGGDSSDPALASDEAKNHLREILSSNSNDQRSLSEEIEFLKEAVVQTHEYLLSKRPVEKKRFRKQTEGQFLVTTLVLAKIWRNPRVVDEIKVITVNVGDSRVYMSVDEQLNQITVDHSRFNFQIPEYYRQKVLANNGPDIKRKFENITSKKQSEELKKLFDSYRHLYNLLPPFDPTDYFVFRNLISAALGGNNNEGNILNKIDVKINDLPANESKPVSSPEEAAQMLVDRAILLGLCKKTDNYSRHKGDDTTALVVDVKLNNIVATRLLLITDGVNDNLTLDQIEESVLDLNPQI